MKVLSVYAAMALCWAHHSLARSCSDFRTYQALNGTIIENAEIVNYGSLEDGSTYCRVSGSVAYGKRDNSVRFELWLPPRENYNERFMVIGNYLPW